VIIFDLFLASMNIYAVLSPTNITFYTVICTASNSKTLLYRFKVFKFDRVKVSARGSEKILRHAQ